MKNSCGQWLENVWNGTLCAGRNVGLLVLVVSVMSGCASMSDQQKTTGQAAGVGAMLGALTGGIIGNQSDHAAEGAMIGALAGAAGGALYGNHIANRKAEFASEEEYLDACLAQARQVRDETSQSNELLRSEIEELDQKINETMQASADKESTRDETLALKVELDDKLAKANNNLQAVNDEIRVQQDVVANEGESAGQEQLAHLEETIKELEAQKEELSLYTQQLTDMNSRMSV